MAQGALKSIGVEIYQQFQRQEYLHPLQEPRMDQHLARSWKYRATKLKIE